MIAALVLASIRIAILPVAPADEARPAPAVAGLLAEVLGEMQGVELVRLDALEGKLGQRVAALRDRCGDQPDCRLRLGRMLDLNLLLLLAAERLEAGVALELDLLDMGSGKRLRHVSRTLCGDTALRRDALAALLTGVLFPQRLVGRIALRIRPAGATVLLDGRVRLKHAPRQVNLESVPAGRHNLRIERAGYRDFIAIVQVPFQGVSQLDVELQPAPPADPQPASEPP